MLTWTTYGTWLQGDRRCYVKNAKVLPGDEELYRTNQKQMKFEPVRLSRKQQAIVRETILAIAENAQQKVFALTVTGNHLHLLLEPMGEPFAHVVSRYKNTARKAIEAAGFNGKLWTRGFDKRYCNSDEELINKIQYIANHKNSVTYVKEIEDTYRQKW